MYCTKCGAKLREGAKFCHACGQPVVRMKPAQSDKTAVRSEIKEKVVDLAKAGAKQVLEALKDRDINASATPGEVSCKPDAAQSAFMKLLKKGLLGITVFLGLSSPLSAQKTELKFQTEGPVGELTLKFTGVKDIRFKRDETANQGRLTFHYYEGTLTSDQITVETIFVPSPDNSPKACYSTLLGFDDLYPSSNEDGYDYEDHGAKPPKRDRSAPGKSLSFSAKYSMPQDAYGIRVAIAPAVDLAPDKYGPGEDQPLGTMMESFLFNFILDGPTAVAEIDTQASSEADDVTPGTYDTEGIEGIVDIDDNSGWDASDDSEEHHPGNWKVPAAVIGAIAAGAALRAGRKKDAGKKSKNKNTSSEGKGEKDDTEDKDDDDEKATYEMRIRKDFGDTLTPGGAAQKVYARIVRIPQGGKAATDSVLTSKISITGDSYLNVSGQNLSGGYMSASVEAPQSGSIPDEAVVNFRLSSGGGSFTNRMHFKVAKSEIVFFQENLTLPACSDEAWRLPFAVKGASKTTTVESCSSVLEKYDVKIEPGEKDGLFYAVIKEKAKDKKEAGTWEQFSLGIKVTDGKLELADSLPLYRFHLGLKFAPHSTIPCYLQTSATGNTEVAKAYAQLAWFDWDPETNDIVTIFPVPTDFKITAKGEKEQGYLDKLGICCRATATTTENGRQLEIFACKGILDAPTRFKATISIAADCGQGRVETVSKEVLIASQPVRQNVTAAMYDEDKRIGDGLVNIQSSIWNNGEYSRLFPLYKLIDVMLDGYDGAYGYDKHQLETVKDVYSRFLRGELAGANATAERVTLADEMRMFVDSFLQTSEEVENSMGFFTRMAVGVATLGMSDVVFTSLQVARDMKATVEKGGGVYDVFVVGVKAAALEAVTDFDVWKGVSKKLAPKQFEAAAKSVENMTKKAKEAASDYFSETIGKKTKGILENSKIVKSKAASQADDAIDAFRKHPEMSDLDKKLDQVYKNGQAHGKAKVDDLQAAQWLMENNPTPENVKLYKKKVLEVQRDKFAMHEMNKLADGNTTRATFNKELDNVYKDVDDEVRKILKEQGYELDEKPFAATSSNKADLAEGKKVTFDRDVTYKTVDGKDVPQKAAQEAYEKAFYKRTTGIDAPSDKAAREWAQMHDQSVVQKGSKVSYEEDLNPVIKDWDQKLSNAEHTGDVMTYKSTEWFEQTNDMIKKANTLEDSGLRLDMLEQALSKRQEAARQMVKQFRYVHERDLAAQTKGAISRISEKMRYGMEISSRLFATGADQLTLGEVEAILAKKDLTLELLSNWLGKTLTTIG